jgi:hypothetical protein
MTPEEFNQLPANVQAVLVSQGRAPQPAAPEPPSDDPDASDPWASDADEPDLDDTEAIPEQGSGPKFLPFAPFSFEGTLLQVKHRPGNGRSAPNYYATIRVDKASESAQRAEIIEGTIRAFYWPYTPIHQCYGKEQDKSKASLGRYRQFVREVCGLPSNGKVSEASGDLIRRSVSSPSLGIKLLVVSEQGSAMKTKPGYFYNIKVIPRTP